MRPTGMHGSTRGLKKVKMSESMPHPLATTPYSFSTFACSFESPIDPSLTMFIHLLTSNDAWARFRRKGKLPKPDITEANAIAVWQAILERRRTMYPNSLAVGAGSYCLGCADKWQGDLQLVTHLKNGRQRNAVIVRIGEQRVLAAVARALSLANSAKRFNGPHDIDDRDKKRRKWKQTRD